MRKKKLLLTGTLLFMSWCTIQLYLFVHKPQSHRFISSRKFPWFISGGSNENLASEYLNNNNINHIEKHPAHAYQTDYNHYNIHSSSSLINNKSKHNKSSSSNGRSSDTFLQDNQDDKAKRQKQFDLDKIDIQVEHLEHDLSRQTKSTEVMLRLLKTIGKLAKSMNKTVKQVIQEEKFLSSFIGPPKNEKPVICVLLFACNRITVKRNLDQLFKYRNDPDIFPIVVSQDCNHEPTRQIIESYGDKLKFIQQPDQSDIVLKGKNQKKFKGYYKISRHYGWALNYTFNTLNYETVLIVEDDLDIAPDFFEYFLALYPILRSDPSLYCISAWNDNGKNGLVEEDPTKLFRSDFFPGLGWMLTKDLWLEFQNKWPKAFWDDWIREPEQRKNRACIRPELSRTKTFGKKGVSNGLFFEKHLKFIKLNEQFVPFTKMNLSYLLKENYDVEFLKQVYNSRLISLYDVRSLPAITNHQYKNPHFKHSDSTISLKNNDNNHTAIVTSSTMPPLASKYSVRIQYDTKDQFKKAAKMFGLMDDFKSGVPRTGYQGTVGFMSRGYRVYLAPSPIWNGYNITWK